jgi:hypothetical protein
MLYIPPLRFISLFTGLLTGFILFPMTVLAAPPSNLESGQWYMFPDSNVSAVDPENDPTANPNYPAMSPWAGSEGQAAVMNDWAGEAYDIARNRLMIWGGGHGGYAGNEVYAFDLNSGVWSRITDPYANIVEDSAYYPVPVGASLQPASTHSYDHLEYLPTSTPSA